MAAFVVSISMIVGVSERIAIAMVVVVVVVVVVFVVIGVRGGWRRYWFGGACQRWRMVRWRGGV